MSYTSNLQSIFRTLSGGLIPNPDQDQAGAQAGILPAGPSTMQQHPHSLRRSQNSLSDSLHPPGPFFPGNNAQQPSPHQHQHQHQHGHHHGPHHHGHHQHGLQHTHPPHYAVPGGNYVLSSQSRTTSQRSLVSDGGLPRARMPSSASLQGIHSGDRMDVVHDQATEQEESAEDYQEYDDDEEGEDGSDMEEDDEDEEEDEATVKEQEKAQERQSDMRKRIMLIQQDSSIPAAEKAKKIQELMTQGWSQTQQSRATTNTRVTNRLENRRRDFSHVTDVDREPTFHDRNQGVLGCKHYQRAAKLQAHCCGKWDTCRFCHDEVSDHNIVRNLITTMLCMYCGTVQPAGQDCINEGCRRRVAKYYCKECKLWDSDPRKNIYHCYDCGICRIGKGLGIDYFHCKKCNVCMAISLKGRHKCIERNLESDCPICGEYMFTSTTTVIFMPCGHCIHYKCHQEYIQTSYQCPTCLKSLADMTDYFRRIDQALAQQQMPQEYSNLYNQIYCNDCEKKCFAKFHFMYHKCVNCRGYNTKVLNTADQNQIPPEELKQINALAALLVNSANPSAAGDTADASSVQEAGGSRRASAAGRGASRRASMVQRGVQFWCHQCQASTNPVMVAGSQRCGTCDSDFLEQL